MYWSQGLESHTFINYLIALIDINRYATSRSIALPRPKIQYRPRSDLVESNHTNKSDRIPGDGIIDGSHRLDSDAFPTISDCRSH